MNKKIKIQLTVALCLVLCGLIVFGGALSMLGWDFGKLSTAKYETALTEVNEAYTDIRITAKTADILFRVSPDGKTTVTSYDHKRVAHPVTVEDGVLTVGHLDTRKWYEYISIGGANAQIVLSLPAAVYGALAVESRTGDMEIPSDFRFASVNIALTTGDVICKASSDGEMRIQTSTGDITVADASVGSLSLSVTTGKVQADSLSCAGAVEVKVSTGKTHLCKVTCQSLVSEGNTGDISLQSVLAATRMTVERSTGDVLLDGSDAAELYIKTDTGDVVGSLLSDKIFFVETDTGHLDYPKTTTGGRCEIKTDTGDVIITVRAAS